MKGMRISWVIVGVAVDKLASEGSAAAHSITWELVAWSSVVAAGFAGGHLASRGFASPGDSTPAR